jgi:hypothetical protein
MKNFILTFLVLTQACTQLRFKERSIAGLVDQSQILNARLNTNLIFANGANAVMVEVELPETSKAEDIKIISDANIRATAFRYNGKVFSATVTPNLKSPSLRLIVVYKNQLMSPILNLQTTLSPLKDKLDKVPWSPNGSSYVSGMTYARTDNMPVSQFEGFHFSNRGHNSIAPKDIAPHVQRSFDFEFDQQATQNISMMVVDSPNATTSHGMYSHMMIFPRTHLPFVEIQTDQHIVTLPNGEQMVFDPKSNTIIGGVFEEGPIDIGPDRFTRQYADLRYLGQGILLRANARGQMPQQGQFESTKIDMNYGVKFSADVLIINGSTGERCRRPKADFWLPGDHSPILFKFPTDQEFDRYLKANCGFGIPAMPAVQIPEYEGARETAQKIWVQCEDRPASRESEKNYLLNPESDYIASNLRNCLNLELAIIDSDPARQKTAFELYLLYLEKKQVELSQIDQLQKKEIEASRAHLMEDLSWVQDASLSGFVNECSQESQKTPQQFLVLNQMPMNDKVQQMCQELKASILKNNKEEVSQLSTRIIQDSSWLKALSLKSTLKQNCVDKAKTFISGDFKLSHLPAAYEPELSQICEKAEQSTQYQQWVREQVAALEVESLKTIREELERLAINKAKSCVITYPINNTINRIRFKFQRDKCLTDSWGGLEKNAISNVFRQGIVREWLTQSSIERKVQLENRSMQQKIMNDYFK